MKWSIFTHRPAQGSETGTSELNRWDLEGDEEGYVADEAVEELALRGYRIVDVYVDDAPEQRRGRRR